MEVHLLDKMLNAYRSAAVPVAITLQNNVRLVGRIREFDGYVIVLDSQKHEIVYRHAVASVAAAPAAEKPRPAQQQTAPPKQQPKAANHPPRSEHGRKPAKPAANRIAAESAEGSINSGMKEGLLRWMQEQKARK